jgi:hypothetical protein
MIAIKRPGSAPARHKHYGSFGKKILNYPERAVVFTARAGSYHPPVDQA